MINSDVFPFISEKNSTKKTNITFTGKKKKKKTRTGVTSLYKAQAFGQEIRTFLMTLIHNYFPLCKNMDFEWTLSYLLNIPGAFLTAKYVKIM